MIQQVLVYVRSSSWPCLRFFKLKIIKILKSGLRRTAKELVAMGKETFIAIGVLHVELLASQVSMVSAPNKAR